MENAIELAEKIGCIIQPMIINATKSILPKFVSPKSVPSFSSVVSSFFFTPAPPKPILSGVNYQQTSEQVPVEDILLAFEKEIGIEPTQAKINLLELKIEIYSGKQIPLSTYPYPYPEKLKATQTAIVEKCIKEFNELTEVKARQEEAESLHIQKVNIPGKYGMIFKAPKGEFSYVNIVGQHMPFKVIKDGFPYVSNVKKTSCRIDQDKTQSQTP